MSQYDKIQAVVTMWPSLTQTTGFQAGQLTWGGLFRNFDKVVPFAGDYDHAGWSAAEFDPCERALENVVAVSALVLDYDGTETLDTAAETWKAYYGLIHTTRKHTPGAHRFRVVLPLSRLVTSAEYAGLWKRVYAMGGGKPDSATKDPSRFWFTPGTPNQATYHTRRLPGEPMNPDVILLLEDPLAKVTPPILHRVTADPTSVERRAAAYLAKMPEAVSGQHGHDALWNAAQAVVHGFGLGEAAAFSLLWGAYNPRCQPPWSEAEIMRKIREAGSKSRISSPAGYKLDERRDWCANARPTVAPKLSLAKSDQADKYADAEEWDRGGSATTVRPADETGGDMNAGGEPDIAEREDVAKKYGVRSMGQILSGVFHRATQPKAPMGARCGIHKVDTFLGGFRRRHVTVLGASTSWGKSTFATLTSDVSMRSQKRVLLVSGEDSEELYGQRLMARRAGVSALRLRDGEPDPDEVRRMANVLGGAETEPFFLDGVGKTAEYLAAAIRSICAEYDMDLVIVDYLQAYKCAKRCQDRRTEITHIAREFTDAIKESNAAGLLLSQLKRLEDNQRPTKHDLKESGDVENMAEHVLLGYTQCPKGMTDDGSKKRFLLIDKNKDGPVPELPFEIVLDPKTASFVEQRVTTIGHTTDGPSDRYATDDP